MGQQDDPGGMATTPGGSAESVGPAAAQGPTRLRSASPDDPRAESPPCCDETVRARGSDGSGAADTAPGLAPNAAARTAASRTGGTRFGRYRLLRALGAGGMGVVWEAWDESLGRSVALKQIREEAAREPGVADRFLREARLAGRLRHPGIVAVRDVGEMDGRPFLTMDFVAGRTLSAYLAETRESRQSGPAADFARLPEEIGILAEIADAVAHAHEQGVIHRDLKPANILLDDACRPRVMDFGLAREVAADSADAADASRAALLTATGDVLGTPAYMAPEQAVGDRSRIGPATDVWALGVLLYEMLTGRTPFESLGNPWRIVSAVATQDLPSPAELAPVAPAPLVAICLAALERDSERRLRSAGEFAAELRRWRDGGTVRAKAPGAWARLRRRGSRHPVLVAALAFAVLAVGAGVLWRGRSAERTRAMLDGLRASVREVEEAVMTTAWEEDAERELVRQRVAALATLVRESPGFGPAHSWFGAALALVQRTEEADAELDRGCALSPDLAVVWYLRGMNAVQALTRSALPRIALDGRTRHTTEYTSRQKAWRERARSDLGEFARIVAAGGAMPGAGGADPFLTSIEVRHGLAVVAAVSEGSAALEKISRLLAGADHPKAWRQRGVALFELGEHAEAHELLTRVVAIWARDMEAWYYRALCSLALADRAEREGRDPRAALRSAADDLGQAARIRDESGAARDARGIVLRRLARAEAAHGGDPRDELRRALADHDEAVALDPRCADNRSAAWTALGDAEAARGIDPRESYRRAIEDAALAREAGADALGVRVNGGGAWLALGEWQAAGGLDEEAGESYRRAATEFDLAVQVDPECVEARLARGTVGWRSGRAARAAKQDPRVWFERALADLDWVLDRRPAAPGARNTRGNVHLDLAADESAHGGDPRVALGQAIADFDAALEANAGDREARCNRAIARMARARAEATRGADPREEMRAAIADYGTALEAAPGDGVQRGNRGNAWMKLAEAEAARGSDPRPAWAAAEEDFRAAIEQGNARAHLELGMLCGTTHRWDEAIAEFEAGAKALPGYADWAKARIEQTRRMKAAAEAAGR